ncbi:hypothetical protein Poly51_16710 [Rubripirellula tenax]|uniref:Uncharacterized protein n=1 Tax=Rubripirellula tenax TaxID=2528015 RepID=A0A5C6FH31_9BACT|nr:hypothetical protein [Rubripirellula tenax]TWU58891.1 hypothetical protein Poly51_16710 [Rubripirellula tenax]
MSSSSNPFHVYLYGRGREPIPTSFEASSSRLEGLPLLHFEPDGSFVWVRDGGGQQIYGMIYDAAGLIQYCELQGKCTLSTWVELRHAITGDPASDDLELMRLPEQKLQDLQSFEQFVWGKVDRV